MSIKFKSIYNYLSSGFQQLENGWKMAVTDPQTLLKIPKF